MTDENVTGYDDRPVLEIQAETIRSLQGKVSRLTHLVEWLLRQLEEKQSIIDMLCGEDDE